MNGAAWMRWVQQIAVAIFQSPTRAGRSRKAAVASDLHIT